MILPFALLVIRPARYVAHLLSAADTTVYQNVGIFVLRKYAGLLDLPFVFLTFLPRLFTSEPSSERALLVGSWRQYFTARAAFHSHASQLVWDRYLCVVELLSRPRLTLSAGI